MQENSKAVEKGSLPVCSKEDKVKENCMRLYIYLLSISKLDCATNESRKAGRRQFQQKDFSINKIHTDIGLDAKTIKKYWKQLEDDNLIRYEGQEDFVPYIENGGDLDDKERSKILTKQWETNFMKRKSNKNGYYSFTKPSKYRIIPKETIDKLLYKFEVSEMELKIYLLLGNLQEYCIYSGESHYDFNYADMIELLGLKNEKKNRLAILKSLVWLKEIKLIDFEIKEKKNGNFNQTVAYFHLNGVNFYTNYDKKVEQIADETGVLPQELKDNIINNSINEINE